MKKGSGCVNERGEGWREGANLEPVPAVQVLIIRANSAIAAAAAEAKEEAEEEKEDKEEKKEENEEE